MRLHQGEVYPPGGSAGRDCAMLRSFAAHMHWERFISELLKSDTIHQLLASPACCSRQNQLDLALYAKKVKTRHLVSNVLV